MEEEYSTENTYICSMASLNPLEFRLIEALIQLNREVNYITREEIHWPMYLNYLCGFEFPENHIFKYFFRTEDVKCFAAVDNSDTVYISGVGGPYIVEVIINVHSLRALEPVPVE